MIFPVGVSKHGGPMDGDLILQKSKLQFTFEPTPSAPTAALNATAGNLNGTYTWRVTFVTAGGETDGGTASGSVAPANQQADLSAIPLGTAGVVTARKIYRNKAADANAWYLVATLNDNTTTAYTDNIADVALTTIMPRMNTTAGIIVGLINPTNFLVQQIFG